MTLRQTAKGGGRFSLTDSRIPMAYGTGRGGGVSTYYFGHFPRKLHEIEKKIEGEGTSLRVCLLVPSPSKFIIIPMKTDHLTGRMGSVPILPIKWSISVDTM